MAATRHWTSTIGGAVLGTLLVLGAPTGAASQDDSPGAGHNVEMPAVGPAELDWRIRAPDGTPYSVAAHRGEVLVVNMWASWCAPCVRELRSFEKLRHALAGTGVRFLFVSPEETAVVRRFARLQRLDLPFYVEDQRLPDAYGLRALPTTYVIDRAGRIVLEHRGSADWNTPEVQRFLRYLDERSKPR